jgi:hypothetical protein
MIPTAMLLIGLPLYLALRIGVLTCVAVVIVTEWLISAPMLPPSHWGSGMSLMAMTAVVAATAFAFRMTHQGSTAPWR